MKRHTAIRCILCLLLLCFKAVAGETDPVRHALVVAISDYHPQSGFRHISAENDVRIIMKLLKQLGFTDTIVLRNELAARENFLRAFEQLNANVKPGDVVFIQFSTHGQQLQDLDGDEADGMDEAIALYDAYSTCTNGYKGEKHLTDDEFGLLIEQLRKALGNKGDLLVMIDACHSGSMTRGEDGHIRGGYSPLYPGENAGTALTRGIVRDERAGMFSAVNRDSGNDRSGYVMISACEKNEISTEYYYNQNHFGPLTWAFLGSVLNNPDSKYTYGKLYHDIRYRMMTMFDRSGQHPVFESAGSEATNRLMFGGINVVQQPYFTIRSFVSDNSVLISAGSLNGISDSTLVSLYPAGTSDPANAGIPIAKGVVTGSGYLESEVKLDGAVKQQDPGAYWVFVTSARYRAYRLKIGLGAFTDQNLRKQVLGEINSSPYILIAPEDPLYILKQSRANSKTLTLKNVVTNAIRRDSILPSALQATLYGLAVSDFLKKAEATAVGISMDISFQPAGSLSSEHSRFAEMRSSRYVFHENKDTAILQIVNTGTQDFYFNIIDIDPEDHVSVFIPNASVPVSDCFLRPGEQFRIPISFRKPYGTEILKVIASGKKLDLTPVITDGRPLRGDSPGPADIFRSIYETRGAEPVPAPYELATFNFFFDVIK